MNLFNVHIGLIRFRWWKTDS